MPIKAILQIKGELNMFLDKQKLKELIGWVLTI